MQQRAGGGALLPFVHGARALTGVLLGASQHDSLSVNSIFPEK